MGVGCRPPYHGGMAPPRPLVLPLLLVACASCASMERMWRISPMSREASEERVNLWPLAYRDGGAVSVLWPLLDVDERGFALRPLVAKDGPEWGVLYPFSSWNTETGRGWILNYYRFEENSGLFPVANVGQGLSYVGPAWWKRDEGGEVTSRGLFPIAKLGDFSYVGPAWWTADSGGLFPLAAIGDTSYAGPIWWQDRETFGVLPLFGVGSLTHVGPVWWRTDGEAAGGLFPLVRWARGGDDVWLLPFYSHDRTEEASTYHLLLGLGRSHRTPRGSERWLLPLFYDREDATGGDTVLFPLWWAGSRTGGEEVSKWRTLLPFYLYRREGEDRSLLSPLGGFGWNPTEEKRFVNVLGPLFHRSRDEAGEESRTAFLWPLFESHRKGDQHTLHALPFYARKKTPSKRETWYAMGLGHARSSESGSSWRLWPLASVSEEDTSPDWLYDMALFSRNRHGETRTSWLFPLYQRTRDAERDEIRSLLGLGYASWHGSSSRVGLWPLFSVSSGQRDDSLGHALTLFGSSTWEHGSSFHLLGPLLYRTSEERREGSFTEDTRALFFLRSRHEEREPKPPVSRFLEERNLVERRRYSAFFDAFLVEHASYDVLAEPGASAEPVERVDRTRVRVPLLYGYEREGSEVDWSGPLWSVRSHSSPAEDRSSFRFLYYLYRSETEGERTQRDVFPFLTWDTGPDEVRVSFLWRLFRYERRNGKTAGNFLFVPWGSLD